MTGQRVATCMSLKINGIDFEKLPAPMEAFVTLKQPGFFIVSRELVRKYLAALHVKTLPIAR